MTSAHDPRPGTGRNNDAPQWSSARALSRSGPYIAAGLVGAAVGSVAGILLSESFKTVLLAGLKLGVFAASLGLALFIAMQWHHHRALDAQSAMKVAGLSFLAGAVSGGLAQALHNVLSNSGEPPSWVIHAASWILLGGLLGAVLSFSATTLSPLPAISAGLLSGVIAGVVGWATSGLKIPPFAWSIASLTVFGAALGLLTFLIQRGGHSATVEVHWSPENTTTVALGRRPVTVGGGADDIVLQGAPPRVSTIALENGVIEHIETSTGKRTPLKDGSRLRIGGVVMVVHAPH
jgi:hypothetical protein